MLSSLVLEGVEFILILILYQDLRDTDVFYLHVVDVLMVSDVLYLSNQSRLR